MPITAKQALLHYAEFLKRSGYLYVQTSAVPGPPLASAATATTSPAVTTPESPREAGAPPMPVRKQAPSRTAAAPAAAPCAPSPPSPPAPDSDATDTPAARAAELAAWAAKAAACTKCPLHRTRTRPVFSDGPSDAPIMFVGEGPGAEEDAQGLPFVGRSGQLLNKMIEAIGFSRREVYICNTVKCRPPENRDPLPAEKDACEPFLERQIALVRPKLIVALGSHAAQYLCRSDASIGALRGRWHSYQGVPLRATYHPAFLLRSPGMKTKAWEDFQAMHARYCELNPADARKIWSKD